MELLPTYVDIGKGVLARFTKKVCSNGCQYPYHTLNTEQEAAS